MTSNAESKCVRQLRLDDDLKKAVSVISGVNQSITSHSIKDTFCLGRFSAENSKPRPLLVKFIRAADATIKRGSPRGSPVVIKPNMSPNERKCESILLMERWTLIQSSVPCEFIKISGSRLLFRNKLYGQVSRFGSDLLFSRHNFSSVVNNSAVQSSSPIVPNPSLATPQLSQSQAESLPVTLNANGCSATSQDQSSAHPPLSSPAHPPQSSTTTPVSDQ